MSYYSVPKCDVIGLVKSAAPELGKNTIPFNALIPGLINSPLTHNETGWSALIGKVEANENPPKNPTEEQAAAVRAPHVPLKVPSLKPEYMAPAVSPASLAYLSQAVGTTSSAQTVTLANSGNASLTGIAISITGADAASFTQGIPAERQPARASRARSAWSSFHSPQAAQRRLW